MCVQCSASSNGARPINPSGAEEAEASVAHLHLLEVSDPQVTAQHLRDQLAQRWVAEGQPAALSDTIGLVLELACSDGSGTCSHRFNQSAENNSCAPMPIILD